MGEVALRIEGLLARVATVPWPERERLDAWAARVGDDPAGAAASAPADFVIAIAGAFGADPAPGVRLLAGWVREMAALLPKKDARFTRVAFAAEAAGTDAPFAVRAKLVDIARSMLRDAEALASRVVLPPRASDLERRAHLEALRATAFACLATIECSRSSAFGRHAAIDEGADAFSNLAHAVRQTAHAFAAAALARSPEVVATAEQFERTTASELARLAVPIRSAYAGTLSYRPAS